MALLDALAQALARDLGLPPEAQADPLAHAAQTLRAEHAQASLAVAERYRQRTDALHDALVRRQRALTADDAPRAEGALTGRVTDKQSGVPLPGLRVRVAGDDAITAVTDADGRFALDAPDDARVEILGADDQPLDGGGRPSGLTFEVPGERVPTSLARGRTASRLREARREDLAVRARAVSVGARGVRRSEARTEGETEPLSVREIDGVGKVMEGRLREANLTDVRAVAEASPRHLAEILRLRPDRAEAIARHARRLVRER